MSSLSRLSHTEDRAVSHSEFAALQGCRHSYVTKLKRNGRLVMTEDGKKILLNASRARIEETKDPARAPQGAQETISEPAGDNGNRNGSDRPSDDEIAEPAGESHGYQYQAARAKRERYQAEMARLEYEQAAGKVLPLDVVLSSVSGAVTQLRTRLESLPAILAPRLASETDEQTVSAVLSEEIEHMLGELARQFGRMGDA